tara:strand:+ start:501 stop:1145 length:645 start_codon:yes stop_codon:yes gene_type:complete
MDFNTLLGILGPDARQAVAEFYLNEDGVPTYGSDYQPPTTAMGVGGAGPAYSNSMGGAMNAVQGDAEQIARGQQFSATGRIDPNSYLGDDKEGASLLFADVIRAQTQDYLTRFAPIEDFLAGTITQKGTTFLEGDMQRTQDAISQGAQSARDQYTRRFERYGVAGRQLDNNLTETSAMVGGMNDARDRDVDRKIALLGGGLGSISMKSRSQQGG